MKNSISLKIFILVISTTTFAQVGVNTSNPKGSFHVDGNTDNPKSGSPNTLQLSNDFIVEDKTSNVGIGTLPESNSKININIDTNDSNQIGKGFRLKDGTEGNGHVLSLINTQGDIAWKQRISTVNAKHGTGYTGPISNDMVPTTSTISLPPGKWLIRSSIILRIQDQNGTAINGTYDDGVYAQLSWADLNSTGEYILTADAESGNLFGGAYLGRYGLAFGQTIINNTSAVTKTYYLVSRKAKTWGTTMDNKYWRRLAGEAWGENAIIAFAAN
jgi:hypothetical protein